MSKSHSITRERVTNRLVFDATAFFERAGCVLYSDEERIEIRDSDFFLQDGARYRVTIERSKSLPMFSPDELKSQD